MLITALQVVLIVFVLSASVQFWYWIVVFGKLANYEEPECHSRDSDPGVTIIICSRNDVQKLEKNLPRILNQSYRSFEVLVVDDDSDDYTQKYLLEMEAKHPKLRSVKISNKTDKHPGKKFALSRGIESALHDILLLTDADCTPSSQNWVEAMVNSLSEESHICLGYSPYDKEPGWLNIWIRFEAVYTAVQYLSFALCRMPYMGVGRNLMYKKKIFLESQRFSPFSHIASGDDDLFINSVANSENTVIEISKKSWTISKPVRSLQEYIRQKKRHYTTGKYYKTQNKIRLSLLHASHILFFIGGIVLLLSTSTLLVALLIIGVRMIVVLSRYRSILETLGAKDLLIWIPILDIGLVIHFLIFLPATMTGKKIKWK